MAELFFFVVRINGMNCNGFNKKWIDLGNILKWNKIIPRNYTIKIVFLNLMRNVLIH